MIKVEFQGATGTYTGRNTSDGISTGIAVRVLHGEVYLYPLGQKGQRLNCSISIPSGDVNDFIRAIYDARSAVPVFIDAQNLNVPSPVDLKLESLCPGDEVRVCSEGELLWVKVRTVNGDDVIGTVDCNPRCDVDLEYGDMVRFEKRHIYHIVKKGDE